ncbi:hypothetical protein M422DRAFT_147683, partial [Sphaerobolus stellatus SS14]
FSPKRIEEIAAKINIGPDLSDNQCEGILNLVQEFADIFALLLSEVFPVDFMQQKLNVKPD